MLIHRLKQIKHAASQTLLLVLLVASLLLVACGRDNTFKIEGTVTNATSGMLYLSEFDLLSTNIIDSTEIDEDGSFSFDGKTNNPTFYQLSLSKNNFVILGVLPGEEIEITADATNLSATYTTKGSETTAKIEALTKHLTATKASLDSLVKIAITNKGTVGYDSLLSNIDKTYTNTIKAQKRYSIGFIIKNLNSIASLVALYQQIDENNYVLNENKDLQYVKLLSDTLQKYYPASKLINNLLADRNRLFAEYSKLKLESFAKSATVRTFPEIKLPGVTKDTIALSSVKSKLVLVNFWNPQNEDCMYALKGMKDLTKKFSESEFTIYNIALYDDVADWRNMVIKYELPGKNVIDERMSNSVFARIYAVKQLPASFLIKPSEGILQRDIFGDNLEKAITLNLK